MLFYTSEKNINSCSQFDLILGQCIYSVFNIAYATRRGRWPLLITRCHRRPEELKLLHTDYFRQIF